MKKSVKLIKYSVGIDMSKDKFDSCIMSIDVELEHKVKATRSFANSPYGFKEFFQWVAKHCKEQIPVHFLVEASGIYHEKFTLYLIDKGQRVSVVLPNKAKKFMQAEGIKSKNDKIDAKGLALIGARQKFYDHIPLSRFYYDLRQLTRHHQTLQEARTSFCNQLHAFQHSSSAVKDITRHLEKNISLLNKQIEETAKLIATHIESDPEVKRKVDQICKIKGVAILTVATLLAETNGFTLFKNIPQLVSYAGYDVVQNQSGTREGKTKISKKGNSRIRRILNFPAMSVVTLKQAPFVQLYERVYDRTRLKMKGYVAVQKKLLVVIYTLWKKDQAYISDYHQIKAKSKDDATKDILTETYKISDKMEANALFRFNTSQQNEVVPLKGSTTQDEHRLKISANALFRLQQI